VAGQLELEASDGHLPSWILLDTRVYLARRHDCTTVSTLRSRGHAIQLTICLAHPSTVSYVCIDCPDLSHANFADVSRVVRSEKQFLLLNLPLNCSTVDVEQSDKYYMYHAVPGSPSLSRIRDPPPSLLSADHLGIYCCGAGEDYILAGLSLGWDVLHLYSSTSQVWTVKHIRLDRSPIGGYMPVGVHKVIPLGGSLFGWVDLWRGMLVCDVLYDDHSVPLWFIPLPGLMPGNKEEHICPWSIRDVTYTNGSLKFVEIEHFRIPDPVM
jgi:hypothetical protein